MGFGSKDNQLHIFNNTSEKVYVMVMPNPDWVWGDLAFSIALSVVTIPLTAGGSAATTAAEVANAVRNLSTLDRIIQGISLAKNFVSTVMSNPLVKAATTTLSAGSKIYKLGHGIELELDQAKLEHAQADYKKVKEWLAKEGMVINPGEVKQVSDLKNWNPLRMMNPSGWGGLFGASDVSLFIATESLSRTALFNTNSDWSWIVGPNLIVRAKYGALRQPSRGDGYYRFSASDRLLTGQFLQPGESLISANRDYDFVYEGDGNAVIYKRDRPAGERVIWASNTAKKAAWRTYMQGDGNFVVYEAEGKPVWASGKHGTAPEFHLCSVVMQDDGNLVVYNLKGQPIWNSNTVQH